MQKNLSNFFPTRRALKRASQPHGEVPHRAKLNLTRHLTKSLCSAFSARSGPTKRGAQDIFPKRPTMPPFSEHIMFTPRETNDPCMAGTAGLSRFARQTMVEAEHPFTDCLRPLPCRFLNNPIRHLSPRRRCGGSSSGKREPGYSAPPGPVRWQ